MNKFKKILLYVGIPLILVLVIAGVVYTNDKAETVDYSSIVEMVRTGKVSEFELNLYSGKLTYTMRADGKKLSTTVADSGIFYNDVNEAVLEYNEQQQNAADKIVYNYESGSEASWLMSMLPSVLMIGVLIVAWIFLMRRMGAGPGGDKTMNFGKARKNRADDEKRKTTFADVAGADEEKEEMAELVQFLQVPK